MAEKDKLVLFQKPNVPITVWFLSSILSRVVPGGAAQASFRHLATIAIIVWALLEIFWGVNYFRRILGLIVLSLVVVGLWR